MGDNIYLGDRDGVRTPMQWTGDRNGGFSRADFAQLYLPPLMDPVYGFQAINVEAQQRDPSSFLHWLRRLLQVRSEHPVFGTGAFEVLHADNPSVLAYLRSDEHDTVLCVNNLSRFPQPCELMLEQHAGKVPVELTGRVPFPPIGELPYFVTLAPHWFYWFSLHEGGQEDPP
jgi:maltose alpha-D-glucosyltransferase/alpha-amylase